MNVLKSQLMSNKLGICLTALLCLGVMVGHAQIGDTLSGKLSHFPTKVFQQVGAQSTGIDKKLTRQTMGYLERVARYEELLKQRVQETDPAAAKTLFSGSDAQYTALAARIRTDSGHRKVSVGGQYFPNADTLQGAMGFLQRYPDVLNKTGALSSKVGNEMQAAEGRFGALQAKLQDAEVVKAFVRSRQEQIGQYLAQHGNLIPGLKRPLAGIEQEEYYYSQRLAQYKAMLSDPGALAEKALGMLSKLPAFQSYMTTHSQLGSLFHLPAGYGTAADVTGLQTKEQVANAVESQVNAGGAAGFGAFQNSIQSAQTQLDGYKDKLKKLGIGNGDAQMPNFKPNDQKTKSFFGRLQYGFDFQVTHYSNYYPSLLALGVSLGYKLGLSNVIGIGAAYQLGMGNGIRDVHMSSQGMGLRSFVNIKIKGSFSASGGFEYNYITPFTSYQQLKQIQDWQRSGLLGITKTVSMKSNVLKQTSLSLLWDFLSYQNMPRTQPILFRMGYNF